MKLAARAAAIAESGTLRLGAEIARLRAAGRDVVSLLEGEPDLPVPAAIVAETAAALRAGRTRYSNAAGLAELKAAISKKLREDNGVPTAAENILIANGAKQALYDILQTLCGPGDEVIVLAPYWTTFPESVRLSGAVPVIIETREGQPDMGAIARAATERTKALIVNSPNNPTGAVYSQSVMTGLVQLARERGIALISDEAYEGLVYDGLKQTSPAALPGGTDCVVTLQTFSKNFGMTGFRVGYAAGPAELIRAAARVHGHVTGNVCTFAQHGAVAALELGPSHRTVWRAEHQGRRDLAFELARKFFDLEKPQGGLFLWADVRRHLGARWKDSAALAAHLLSEGGVAVLPGSVCGGEGHLRISFSSGEETLRDGFARIGKAL